MASVKAPTGIDSYIQYGYENVAFATEVASYDKVFGHNQKLSNLSRRNNVERIKELNQPEAQKLIVKKFEGSFTLDWILGNAYWLKLITGNTSTDAGAGPYTHTYVDVGGATEVAKTIVSFSLENGIDMATDHCAALLGCVIKSLSIKASAGEAITCSAECVYANEANDSTLDSSPAEEIWCDPFIYAHATLELPTATTLADVTDLELTIERDLDMLDALGSRFATQAPGKCYTYTLKGTIAFEDYSKTLQLMLGGAAGPVANPAETATCKINITNGKASTDERTLTLEFAGLQFDESALPQNPDDLIKEDATIVLKQWTDAVYTDNTGVAL